jgi:hypothetical protein
LKLNARARKRDWPPREGLAGAEGFEPPLAVLETAGLPLNLRPYQTSVYLISLCGWCLRQKGQNLLSSSRSVIVFLFFMLV